MSHRPEDAYGYVATETIRTGMVTAFNAGDPVPDSTVEENGSWLEDGLVVKRDEWDGRPEDEPERAMTRGEMPPHLKDKAVPDESATAKSARAGGASSKKPEPTKSAGKDS
jgi:hypothetical protein